MRTLVLTWLLAAGLVAGCGEARRLEPGPPPPPPPPPPPKVYYCEAFPKVSSSSTPEAVRRGRCDWAPSRVEPRAVHLLPPAEYAGRAPGTACVVNATTGTGFIGTIVGFEHDESGDHLPPHGWDIWAFFDPGVGGLVSRFSSWALPDMFDPQPDTVTAAYLVYCNPDFVAQGQCYDSAALGAWGPDGFNTTANLGSSAPEWVVAGVATNPLPPPAAGMALAVEERTPYTVSPSMYRVLIRIFDGRARECSAPWELLRGPPGIMPLFVQVAVDDQRRLLVLYEWWLPFRRSARWYTLDGIPLTDEFEVDVLPPDCIYSCFSSQRRLIPLIGEGVAYQEGHQYLAVFPSGEARHEAAPEWLTAMNGHAIHRVGNRGYAFIPQVSTLRYGAECADRVEFVSLDGDRCGTMRLDTIFPCALRVDVGRDGTLVQTPNDYEIDSCRYALWDRLLE